MLNPFRPLGAALRDLFDDFVLLIVCNALWVVLCLPLWYIAVTFPLMGGHPLIAAVIALLGVLPAGPATAGLVYVAYRVVDGRATKIADFFVGLRQYARPGWMLAAIWVAGMVIITLNFGFYLGLTNWIGALMLGLFLYVLLFWFGVLIYAPSLVFLQDQPDLRTIARNAFLMVMGRPFYTILTLLLMGIVWLLCLFLVVPIFLITFAFLALWGMRATKLLIDVSRRRREAAEAATNPSPPSEERGRRGQVRPK